MTDQIKDFETAADGFEAVLSAAGHDLSGQSPCTDWTAADVIDHVLGVMAHSTEAFGGSAPEITDRTVATFRAQRAAVLEAFGAPGASERLVATGIGDVPAPVQLSICTTDTLVHTWDLARALGRTVELDPELLDRGWKSFAPMDEVLRAPGILGPKVDVPEDSPLQARALAFFGRVET